MIDLKKEHEAFNAEFKRIGREYSSDLNSVGFNGILSANELGWLACAESKQAEIDLLKAQLSKLNDTVQHLKTESSGVHAALREQQRINEDLLEKLFGVDAGEYVIVPKSPTNKMIGNAQGCGENFLFHYQVREVWNSMIETAQEQDND
ncbi:hypothetical protein AVV48_gp15 [Acinetobacter phage phiAC-1]|uniref:hypothetical protein n=1 Tax=Acinetobacter phage phiAC-1 TaxID=1229760 RepID=UPI00028BA2CC|nr:hypothetical protein AVV48_gp15 [Acinetobacter phage phiAC-1]AFU62264.1 hypothetical protein phiAC-1_0015 [Acinetobacter phage phiAC-1]